MKKNQGRFRSIYPYIKVELENIIRDIPLTFWFLIMAVLAGAAGTLGLYRSEETAKLCMLVAIGWLLTGQLIYSVWGI